jgi:hypothetical protein
MIPRYSPTPLHLTKTDDEPGNYDEFGERGVWYLQGFSGVRASGFYGVVSGWKFVVVCPDAQKGRSEPSCPTVIHIVKAFGGGKGPLGGLF